MAEEKRPNGGNPVVEFLYLNTNAEKKFHAGWNDSLAEVWEQAYKELGEARRERDEIESQNDGASLMSYLDLTLEQLREKHICQNRKFQIKCETGGA